MERRMVVIGSPLAFVESEEAAKRFIRDFLAYHNKSLKRSAWKSRKRRKLHEQGVLPEHPYDKPEPDPEGSIPGMIYCDPDAGIELAFGYNGLIPDTGNPWYAGDDDDMNHDDEAMVLLESSHISGKWMHYLVEKYDFPCLEFPGLSGRELLMYNLDFVLRFWKGKGYHS